MGALAAPAYPMLGALPTAEAAVGVALRVCTPRRRAMPALTEAVEGVEPLHTMALTAAPLLAGSVEPGPVPASPEDGSPEDGPPEAPPQPPPETDVLPPLVIAVPEPSTWIMMIVGFGAVGGALRRAGRRFARA